MANTILSLNRAEKVFNYQPPKVDDSETFSEKRLPNNKNKINKKFQNVYDNVVKPMWEAQKANDTGALEQFIAHLDSTRSHWEKVADYNGGTILHAAVEKENLPLVRTLVYAQVNINAKNYVHFCWRILLCSMSVSSVPFLPHL